MTTIAWQSRASSFRATEISKGHPFSLTSFLGELTRPGNTYCLESSFVSFMFHMFYFGISFVLLFGSFFILYSVSVVKTVCK